MKILSIETSCDDTCIAIVKAPPFKVLSNVVSSQTEIHKKWGGVYPTLAKREHQKNLEPALERALKGANLLSRRPDIDLIALTVGPGLEPCLWTGVNFAKELARSWDLPIVPVNHIEAHILANWLKPFSEDNKKIFPAVCLIVSGGHTQLILMKGIGKYNILGETRDDAAGECFDKTARILGLGYPGGPAIAAQADEYRKSRGPSSTSLPRPMINQKNYDFSFSGLKTAVLYNFKSQPPKKRKSKEYIRAMSCEIQQAIIDVLIQKTIRAAKAWRAKTIILGGGVSANNELRKQFNYKLKIINYKLNFLVPPKNLCTDNGVMTAIAGYFNQREEKTKSWGKINANANLRIK